MGGVILLISEEVLLISVVECQFGRVILLIGVVELMSYYFWKLLTI